MSETKRTKPGRPTSNAWKGTTAACEALGVSRWTLAELRKSGQLKKGYHWRVKNPNSARLTYLWQCDRIQKLQGEVLEA